MVITIDGPAASGKSSLAQAIAIQLHIYYLSSGFLYRACTYILHQYAGYSWIKMAAAVDIQDISSYCNPERIHYLYQRNTMHIFFDHDDITPYLKSALIDAHVSQLSAHVAIRQAIHVLQKKIAQNHDIVADGRDMGSVAFPNADYKFFLTASLETRAHRWQQDQAARGNTVNLQNAIKSVAERDRQDMSRSHSPLIIPSDAIVIDNTNMNLQETVEKVLGYIQHK